MCGKDAIVVQINIHTCNVIDTQAIISSLSEAIYDLIYR